MARAVVPAGAIAARARARAQPQHTHTHTHTVFSKRRTWRARLYWSVSLSMSSPAFFDAFSIADMRDDCSDVAPSR